MVLLVVTLPTIMNPPTAGVKGEKARFCPFRNGKVAIVRVAEEVEYKRRVTKNGVVLHERGEKRVVSVTIDGARYKEFLARPGGVFDALRDYFGPDVAIRLQEDGAPGHGFDNRHGRR